MFLGLLCSVGIVSAEGGKIDNPLKGIDDFGQLADKIATEVAKVITYLGVIMIIIAGIFYLTSAGDPKRLETAKHALIYAIIGIAIGVAAQAIVNVVKEVMGA